MKCPICESCEYEQYCGATEIMRKCERHNKKVEQTNEEWFCGLSTEEKARLLVSNKLFFRMLDYDGFVEWLKQPHPNE